MKDNRKSKFAHFLDHKIDEFRYRLNDILNVCNESQQRKGDELNINYKFSAFISLVQTFKDILSILSDGETTWRSLDSVKHIEFIRNARNAMTHDGNPIISLWADGRYFIPCDIIRFNQCGKEVIIKAPTEDIATVCIEFTREFSSKVKSIIEPLIDHPELSSPLYSLEDFKNMSQHPGVPTFARDLIKNIKDTDDRQLGPKPIKKSLDKLDSLIDYCKKN